MIEYGMLVFLGVLAGVFTGLMPGIHPNTVIFGSMPFYFSLNLDLLVYMSFIAGMSVSHTFHDFLPAIFLGAPEAEVALTALPGPRMVMQGRGEEAFLYTVHGGLFSVLAMLISLPVLYVALPMIYSIIRPVIGFLLMFILFFLIFRSDRSIDASIVAVLAGGLGLASFSSAVNQQFVLIPIFSGLFAVPSVIHALKSNFNIPAQEKSRPRTRKSAKGGFIGFLAGLTAGILPGIGAATSTSFLAPLLGSEKEFLASMGGVNTSDILISFISLYLIDSARSGSAVALKNISSITPSNIVFLFGASTLAIGLSLPIALNVGSTFVKILEKIRLEYVLLAILGCIILLSFILTGLLGLIVLVTASLIGYLGLMTSQRTVLMAVLILPTIVFHTPVLFG